MPSPLWYVCSSPYRWHVQDLDKLPCRYTVVTLHPNCYGPRNIPHKVIVSLASTNQVLESKCVSIYSIIYHHISIHIYPYIYICIYICIHNIYLIYISLNPHMFFFVQWGVVAFFSVFPFREPRRPRPWVKKALWIRRGWIWGFGWWFSARRNPWGFSWDNPRLNLKKAS